MATIEEIKQQITDWYDDPEKTFVDAFHKLIDKLSWRRGEVTLPAGIAKLVDLSAHYVVISVGDQLFRVNEAESDEYDWEADDIYEAKVVNVDVVEYHRKDLL